MFGERYGKSRPGAYQSCGFERRLRRHVIVGIEDRVRAATGRGRAFAVWLIAGRAAAGLRQRVELFDVLVVLIDRADRAVEIVAPLLRRVGVRVRKRAGKAVLAEVALGNEQLDAVDPQRAGIERRRNAETRKVQGLVELVGAVAVVRRNLYRDVGSLEMMLVTRSRSCPSTAPALRAAASCSRTE